MMAPTLQKIVLNGATRHRLEKGFFLVKEDGCTVEAEFQASILKRATYALTNDPELADFQVHAKKEHPSLLTLTTPFLPVYDLHQRDQFIRKLATATNYLLRSALEQGGMLLAGGVNPCFAEATGKPTALSADIHQIEMLDTGEIERIYNLFRLLLPELLAISVNSSVYGAAVQQTNSSRMRHNPASFLPRYLSQFNTHQIDRLQRMLRKEYGLANVSQMDINPLGGNIHLLDADTPPPLQPEASALELRFLDAQSSFPFLRAQVVLFQAIAMSGRDIARRGRRVGNVKDTILDANKALAYQNGATAIFTPDKETLQKKDSTFHRKGVAERATNALLMAINDQLLPALQDLACEPWELFPIILGAELRRRGKRCLASYAEYQQYLWYTHQKHFIPFYMDETQQMLTSSSYDPISAYNQQQYRQLADEIHQSWQEKLSAPPRLCGEVVSYDHHAGQGTIQADNGNLLTFHSEDLENARMVFRGQDVTFVQVQEQAMLSAKHIHLLLEGHLLGVVEDYDVSYGYIKDISRNKRYFVHFSDIVGQKYLTVGDCVTFELQSDGGRVKAINVIPYK